MFVIFGASGNTGKVVASTLLDRGAKVRVVSRDPAKVADLAARGAEVVKAELSDGASLDAALRGASGAYFLAPPDPTSDDLVGKNEQLVDIFAAALARTPVAHVAVLSSVGAQLPDGNGPIASLHHAEVTFPKVAGVTCTFVRAAYFMENILANAHPMKADGVLPVFGGGEGHAFPMIATQDIGRVAAEALLAPPTSTQIIELSGPREYSFNDAAEIASKALGRPVKTMVLPLDAVVPTLTKFGMSANVAGLYREMVENMGKGRIAFEGTHKAVRGKVTLEQVLTPALR
jgi:uncharacterized protein YbjT (DUF2867 family)